MIFNIARAIGLGACLMYLGRAQRPRPTTALWVAAIAYVWLMYTPVTQ